MALTEDESCFIENVLSIKGIGTVDFSGNLRDFLLFLCKRHAFEDADITAADVLGLILSKVDILRNNLNEHTNAGSKTLYDKSDIRLIDWSRGFDNDMAVAMSDENLDSDFGSIICFLSKVDDGSGNPVCNLIRMRWIYFFNHS